MAAEVRAKYPDAVVELKPSGGGRFEVHKDGTPVFQKSKLGRHPQPGEVLSLLESAK